MLLVGIQNRQCHRLDAVPQHVQRLGGGTAEVNDAVGRVWPAVVDAHFHRFSVHQAAHAHLCSKRQGAVRGGQSMHVKTLATGRAPAVQRSAVPGRFALLVGRSCGPICPFGLVQAGIGWRNLVCRLRSSALRHGNGLHLGGGGYRSGHRLRTLLQGTSLNQQGARAGDPRTAARQGQKQLERQRQKAGAI